MSQSTIETLLRFGVTGIDQANQRIASISGYATPHKGRKGKGALTSAQDHLDKAIAALYKYAAANDITIRTSMKT